MVLNVPAFVGKAIPFAELESGSFFSVRLLGNWHFLYKQSTNTVRAVHGSGFNDCLLHIKKTTECYPLTLDAPQLIEDASQTVNVSGIDFDLPETLG